MWCTWNRCCLFPQVEAIVLYAVRSRHGFHTHPRKVSVNEKWIEIVRCVDGSYWIATAKY